MVIRDLQDLAELATLRPLEIRAGDDVVRFESDPHQLVLRLIRLAQFGCRVRQLAEARSSDRAMTVVRAADRSLEKLA